MQANRENSSNSDLKTLAIFQCVAGCQVVDDRMQIVTVLLLKTTIRSDLNFHNENCPENSKVESSRGSIHSYNKMSAAKLEWLMRAIANSRSIYPL